MSFRTTLGAPFFFFLSFQNKLKSIQKKHSYLLTARLAHYGPANVFFLANLRKKNLGKNAKFMKK
jgi:uncharacterized lipoprotein YbaY